MGFCLEVNGDANSDVLLEVKLRQMLLFAATSTTNPIEVTNPHANTHSIIHTRGSAHQIPRSGSHRTHRGTNIVISTQTNNNPTFRSFYRYFAIEMSHPHV